MDSLFLTPEQNQALAFLLKQTVDKAAFEKNKLVLALQASNAETVYALQWMEALPVLAYQATWAASLQAKINTTDDPKAEVIRAVKILEETLKAWRPGHSSSQMANLMNDRLYEALVDFIPALRVYAK